MRFESFEKMLDHHAERTPDASALRYAEDETVRTMTYAELACAVAARAEELRALGKTCMGVLADGSKNCLIEIFAAVRAGMQVVLLDEAMPEAALREMLPYTDADTLYGERELCEELSGCLTEGLSSGTGRLLFFTSGTTERSKAVVLTEGTLCASAYNGATLLPLRANDTLLCVLPLAHVFGFVCGVLWGLSCGACVALGRGARHYVDDCAFFRPTAISVVSLLLGFLLKQNAFNDELKLVLVGAGGCRREILDAAKARSLRVCFGYGLTETSSGVALSLGDEPYAMTVCPDDKIILAPDGEILIKVSSCMMQGYYKRPRDTDAALSGGALHTGDLGRFDEKGRLYVTGRKKDTLVLPDGTKLFLPEAETELAKLLPNTDFALVERDDRAALAIYGDKRDDKALFAAIEPYQAARARGQQIASIVRLSEPLPRTVTGKIKRWAIS